MNFGSKNKTEELIFAEEAFRVDIQYIIQKAMNEQGISSEELAKRCQLTTEEIDAIQNSTHKIPIRLIGRICFGLGLTSITLKF